MLSYPVGFKCHYLVSLRPNISIDTFHTENLFDNQELLELAIISFIFMTFTSVSRVILTGESRSHSHWFKV